MRCLLKVSIPTDVGNDRIADGSLSRTIESILNDLKPEAAYFVAEDGQRTAVLFFDLKDSSDLPGVAEPWFLAFNGTVEVTPAMNLDDLMRAAPGIEKAIKSYG